MNLIVSPTYPTRSSMLVQHCLGSALLYRNGSVLHWLDLIHFYVKQWIAAGIHSADDFNGLASAESKESDMLPDGDNLRVVVIHVIHELFNSFKYSIVCHWITTTRRLSQTGSISDSLLSAQAKLFKLLPLRLKPAAIHDLTQKWIKSSRWRTDPFSDQQD